MTDQKQPHIFMVEDDRNNHLLFQTAFGAAGFSITLRRSADGDFVNEVAKAAPDIISMDIMIGVSGATVERDGLEAAELLKADERTRNIPILFLTNFFEPSKIQRAKELGAVDFISLQAHSITHVPEIFKQYLLNPEGFIPTNPRMRKA